MVDWLEVNTEGLAKGLERSFGRLDGSSLKAGTVLTLRTPATTELQDKWDKILSAFGSTDHQRNMQNALGKLDDKIAPALGLSSADLTFIQTEFRDDPFLKRLKPRYPGTETRKSGFLEGLDSAARYV
jgi:hypothetical protein